MIYILSTRSKLRILFSLSFHCRPEKPVFAASWNMFNPPIWSLYYLIYHEFNACNLFCHLWRCNSPLLYTVYDQSIGYLFMCVVSWQRITGRWRNDVSCVTNQEMKENNARGEENVVSRWASCPTPSLRVLCWLIDNARVVYISDG